MGRGDGFRMSTLFVSDLHLDGAYPAAIAQFEQLLRGAARGAKTLYVLGDLFEDWVGDDDDDPDRARVCQALRAYAERGTACFVMHGNRDFLLGPGFAERSHCTLLADPVVLELYGERVLLTHGDALCTADLPYQRLRSVVRTPAWQRRFLRLKLSTRRMLAAAARAGSRAHTGSAAAYIMDADAGAILATMQACGVRTLIHGHTHRPAVHEFTLQGQPARRIVLGAWYEQGSVLRWDRRGYELQTLPRGGPE
jgi:UDP-2,3-diacylglucosamine hydrolase